MPIGFFVCILIQVTTFVISMECYVSAQMLTVGFYLIISDFASDLSVKLREINKDLIELEDRKMTTNEEIWLKKKVVEFVRFHSDARELSLNIFHLIDILSNRF